MDIKHDRVYIYRVESSTSVCAGAVQTTLTFVNKTTQRAQLKFNIEF